jgi:hypothetical protein
MPDPLPTAAWNPPALPVSPFCHVPSRTSIIEMLRRPVEFALTAPVRMKNDALLRGTVIEGHLESVFDQFGAHVIGQGPADHPA